MSIAAVDNDELVEAAPQPVLQPIMELNAETYTKIAAAIGHLEQLIQEDPLTIFRWNGKLLFDSDGRLYATFHDDVMMEADSYHKPGLFRIDLFWSGDEIIAVSEIHAEVDHEFCSADSSGAVNPL